MKLTPVAEDPEHKSPINGDFYMLPAVEMYTDAEGTSVQLATANLLGLWLSGALSADEKCLAYFI